MTTVDDQVGRVPVKVHRSYRARFAAPVGDAVWRAHHGAVTRTHAGLMRGLLQTVAASVDGSWLGVYRDTVAACDAAVVVAQSASPRKQAAAWALVDGLVGERVRVATLIVGSWVSRVPVSTSGHVAPGLPEGMSVVDAVTDQVARVNGGDVTVAAALIRDAAALLADRDDSVASGRFARKDTRWAWWVSADIAVPTAGWGDGSRGLRGRLTGTVTGPGKGDMTMMASQVWSTAFGQSRVDDVAGQVRLGRRFADLVSSPDHVTMGDVITAAGVEGWDGLLDWLWEGRQKGNPPAMIARLKGLTAATRLDDSATAAGVTHRQRLQAAAREFADRWQQRLDEAGQVTAGEWLWDTAIVPGFGSHVSRDGYTGVFTDVLLTAAAAVASGRAKLFTRAKEWGAATATMTGLDRTHTGTASVQAVDEWLTSTVWAARTATGRPVLPLSGAGGRRGLSAVTDAWRTRRDADTAELLTVAADAGSDWDEWWKWLVDHPVVWDTPEAVTAVVDVAAARHASLRLRPPTVTLPNPDRASRGVNYGAGGWNGKFHGNGTATLTVFNGAEFTTIHGRWQSRRLQQVLRLTHPDTDEPIEVARGGDRRAAAVAGAVTARQRHTTITPAAVLASAAMRLTVDPATAAPTVTVSLAHPTTRPVFTAPTGIRVLGVHLSLHRDATWSVWRTLAPGEAPDTGAITPQASASGVTVPRGWTRASLQGRTAICAAVGPATWATPETFGIITSPHRDSLTHGYARGLQAAITEFNDALDGFTGAPLPDPDRGTSSVITTTVRRLRAAVRVNNSLAAAINRGDTFTSRHWPVGDGSDLLAVWAARDHAIHSAVLAAIAMVAGPDTGRRYTSTISHGFHLKHVKEAATAATRRTIPDTASPTDVWTHGYRGHTLTATLDLLAARARHHMTAWAGRIAADIVATAITHHVHLIAVPALTAISSDSAAVNSRLAAWGYGELLHRLSNAATLAGIDIVDTLPTATTRQHPLTGDAGIRVATMPLTRAIRIAATTTWKRRVTDATTTLATPTTHTPTDVAAAQLTIDTHQHLTAAAHARDTHPDPHLWDTTMMSTPIDIPLPWGAWWINPITTRLTPHAGGWRYTGRRDDRRRLGADAIAQAGLRRRIKQR